MGAVSWQVTLGHGWFLFGKTGADFAEICHLFAASSGNIDGPLDVSEIAHATDVHLHSQWS